MIAVQTAFAGYFKMEARKPDGSMRILADWFPNMILNSGLNALGSNGSYLEYCKVGAGTSAPISTQTTLVSQVAETNTMLNWSISSAVTTVTTAPYHSYITRTFRFPVGTATGNLTEVGVGGNAGSSGALFSRALIVDGNGNPTAVTVLADEELVVTYKFAAYPPTTDTNTSIVLNGTTHNVIIRPTALLNTPFIKLFTEGGGGGPGAQVLLNNHNCVAYSGDIITDITSTSSPAGTSASASSSAFGSYVNGSYKNTATYTFSTTAANFAGGIRSVQCIPETYYRTFIGYRFQMQFDPPIPKTSSNRFSLGLNVSWTRR